MTTTSIDEVKAIGDHCLMRWGTWARADGSIRQLGYPRCSPEQTGVRCALTATSGDEGDDAIARQVDAILSRMPTEYKAVAVSYYMHRLPVRRILAAKKCSRDELNERLGVLRGAVFWALG